MYAIIVTGGKQYKVEEGQAIFVEKLDAKQGDKVTFDKVILVSGDDTKIGTCTGCCGGRWACCGCTGTSDDG